LNAKPNTIAIFIYYYKLNSLSNLVINLSLSWKDWKKTDILYGIVAPLIVVLAIVGLSMLNSLIGFSESTGFIIGITMQILELTVIVAVPLLLGLVWNRWAGGASGFLMGSLYSLYWADQFRGGGPSGFHFGVGTILLAYTLSAMLIGYMAGALNKRSEDFRRMVISGVIATAIGGVLLFGIFQLSPSNVVTGWDGFLLNVLPRILCGVLIPVIAKVFFWYGMGVNKKPKD
jgi:hypothetical protein